MTSPDLPLRIKKRSASASPTHSQTHSLRPKKPKLNIPLHIRTHKSPSSKRSPASSPQSSNYTPSPQLSATDSSLAGEDSSQPPSPTLELEAPRRDIALQILDNAEATMIVEGAGFPADEDEEYGADGEESSSEEDAFMKSYREVT